MCNHAVLLLQHVGDLGNIVAEPDGRALFRLEDSQIKVAHNQIDTYIKAESYEYVWLV